MSQKSAIDAINSSESLTASMTSRCNATPWKVENQALMRCRLLYAGPSRARWCGQAGSMSVVLSKSGMQKEIRRLTLLEQVRFLPKMWRGKVANASLAQGGLPTRKRKLRKECAPESLQRTLQVDNLPEVWALVVQRPVLKLSEWFLEVPCGTSSVGNQAMFWAGLDVSQWPDHWSDQRFSLVSPFHWRHGRVIAFALLQ